MSWVVYSRQVNIDGSFALLRVFVTEMYKKKKNSLTKHISPLVANIFILRFTIFKYLGEFSGFFFVSNEFNSVFVAVVACAEGEIVNVCVAFLTAPQI